MDPADWNEDVADAQINGENRRRGAIRARNADGIPLDMIEAVQRLATRVMAERERIADADAMPAPDPATKRGDDDMERRLCRTRTGMPPWVDSQIEYSIRCAEAENGSRFGKPRPDVEFTDAQLALLDRYAVENEAHWRRHRELRVWFDPPNRHRLFWGRIPRDPARALPE